MKTQRPQPLEGTLSLLTGPSIIKKHQTQLWLWDPWKMISQGQRLTPLGTQPVDTGHGFHRSLSACSTGRWAAVWDIRSELCPSCPLRAASSSCRHGFSWSSSGPQIFSLSPSAGPISCPALSAGARTLTSAPFWTYLNTLLWLHEPAWPTCHLLKPRDRPARPPRPREGPHEGHC